MTKHLEETAPDSTAVSTTSVIGMDVDTGKFKVLKLVCHFTMYSKALTGLAEQKEVIVPIDMTTSLDGHRKDFYADLVQAVLNMVIHCAGQGVRTDFARADDVIFYFMDSHGDRLWVESPSSLGVFLKSSETMTEVKLYACSKSNMQKLCSLPAKK